MCNHALLVGYGSVGSLIGAKLHQEGIPIVVIENSRARVDALREQGIKAVLGNANHGVGSVGLRPLAAADHS